MANNIELFKKYVPLLDEVYKEASLTSVLDGAAELAQQGANANELVIPKLDMSGLADYNRNSGYVAGDVSLTYQTVKCNYDRGIKFSVDAMDNAETADVAFGRLAGEFVRTKAAPEVDAFRFAAYASAEGIGTATAALTAGANVVTALRTAATAMDEAEVPADQRILFITPTLKGMIDDLDTTKSREIMSRFAEVITVPQSRFFTAVQLTDNGYAKAGTGKNLNFLIVHKPAVIQYHKHRVPRVFTPEQNQDADAWKYTFRNLGIAESYENKRAGIYAHIAST